MDILSKLQESHQRLAPHAALQYALLGWRVVPNHGIRGEGVCTCRKGADCPDPGKHPRLKGWPSEATTDEDKIAGYWERWPDANLGIHLGPASGIIDVEFDNDEGRRTADRLLGECFTPTYNSRRSVHRIFSFPDGLAIPKAVVETHGLEFRFGTDAKGSQSIFPPSIHATGIAYRWVQGLSPDDVEPQPFPLALAELVRRQSDNGKASSDISTQFTCEGHFWETPGASEGNRTHTLWRLIGRYLAEYGADANLLPWAQAWADKCNPPLESARVQKAVDGLVQKHIAKQQAEGNGNGEAGATVIQPASPRLSIASRPFSQIQPEPIRWLWPNRIALGKLSLLVGQPGQGKTFGACDMMARVSKGLAFPDGLPCVAGEAAILTAEDGADDTIRPRLDAAGADVAKIEHIEGVRDSNGREIHLCLGDHLALLDDWLTQRPEARLVVIDPITAYLGKVDSHENAAVRGILGPVAKLAEKHGVAMLGISHLSKRDTKAINRIIGSIAFVAAARAAWLVAPDPDDESGERRLFLPVKNNLAKASGLAFQIQEGRVVWDASPIFVSADDIETGDKRRGRPKSGANNWLASPEGLSMGERKSSEVIAAGEAAGFSRMTIYRAANEIGVEKQNGLWRLPDDQQNDSYRF